MFTWYHIDFFFYSNVDIKVRKGLLFYGEANSRLDKNNRNKTTLKVDIETSKKQIKQQKKEYQKQLKEIKKHLFYNLINTKR